MEEQQSNLLVITLAGIITIIIIVVLPLLAMVVFIAITQTTSLVPDTPLESVSAAYRQQAVDGQALYMATCASCHGMNSGDEVTNLIGKNLMNNVFVQSQSDEGLLEFIKVGRPIDHPDNTTGIPMLPQGGNPNLTDTDLQHIIAYLRTLENGVVITDMPVFSPNGERVDSPYQWVKIVDQLDSPINIIHANDDSGRLFAIEQGGYILIVENGKYNPQPFLDITTLLPDSVYHGTYTEQGLLGVAFHPDYAENGQFFVSYIDKMGDSVIARYTVMPDDPNRADPNSEVILIQVDQPFEDHNGGNIMFGPDNYLYIAFGDGGRPAEPNYFSQEPDLFLGKMLRIDVNAETYRVPDDNPFIDDPNFLPEIWALGLRNPWRFSFDRLTGDIYIGDVGQWLIEEIDFQPASSNGGENYGWSAYEATQRYLEDEEVYNNAEVTMPILAYTHEQGCSVTGGFVYRGDELTELQGQYIYGDYCSGTVWMAARDANGIWQSEYMMDTEYVISSFGQDADGNLYLVDYKGGIYKLEAVN